MEELRAIRELLEKNARGVTQPGSLNLKVSTLKSSPAPVVDEGSSKPSGEIPQDILTFLESRGIVVTDFSPEGSEPDELYKLASLLGKHYSYIEPFYKKIKQTLNDGNPFTMNMKDFPQQRISHITNFASNLHKLAFLEEYRYFKSPHYLLKAKVNRIPEVINFFTGKWLELFVERTIRDIATKYLQHFSLIRNIKVAFPNGNEGELDILANLDGKIFWIEAKTGDYQRYIAKYAQLVKFLSIEPDRAFLVLTNVKWENTKSLSQFFKMNVIRAEDFPQVFENLVREMVG